MKCIIPNRIQRFWENNLIQQTVFKSMSRNSGYTLAKADVIGFFIGLKDCFSITSNRLYRCLLYTFHFLLQ